MNKIILVSVYLLLKPVLSTGQPGIYQPIPGANVHWRESSFWTVWLPAPTPVYDDYSLFAAGDTTIGLFDYHKLYQNGQITSVSPPVISYTDLYIGAFRQDSLLRRVFIIAAQDTMEQLLYDFSLNAGDTLAASYNNDVSNPNTNGNYVIAVDSVYVGSELHKRLLLSPVLGGFSIPDTSYAIIEGVGSTFGFYHLIEPPFESGSQLICFSHDTINYPPITICPFYLGVGDLDQPLTTLSINPNPALNIVTVTAEKDMTDGRILVHNYLGEQVEIKSQLKGNSVLIEKGLKPSGMYFIIIKDEDQILGTGKVIFID